MKNKKLLLGIVFIASIVTVAGFAMRHASNANAIICVDCGGGGGGGSTTVSATPTLTAATSTDSAHVNLAWVNNDTVTGTFYIYRSTDNVTFTNIANTTATTFSDLIAAAPTYYYYITFIGTGKTVSGNSNTVAALVIAPPTANSVTTVSQTQLTFNFTDNSTNESGFYVYRDGAYAFTVQNGVGIGSVLSVGDTGLTCGTTHSYYVYAYGTGGSASANSATISGTTSACTAVAPTMNSVTATSQTATNVTFTNNDSRAYGQVGFYVYRNGAAVNITGFAVNPNSQYTYGDSGLACGTSYSYQIEARLSGGSSWSGTMSGSTSACVAAPAAPTVTAMPASGISQINTTWSSGSDRVRVYLKGPTGYTLASDSLASTAQVNLGGLTCPYPYQVYFLSYNNDTSVTGVDASCSNALSAAGITGPAAPSGARCASSVSTKPVSMRFCTQQFLGN